MKLFTTKPYGGNALVSFRHKRIALWRRFEWLHARRGGGPVLRDESSWRTVCGFVIQGRDLAPHRPVPWLSGPHVTGVLAFLVCHDMSGAP